MTQEIAAERRENGKLGGRPRTVIDWEEFDKLCEMHATVEEIAGWFRLTRQSIHSIVKRDKGVTFKDYWAERSAGGRASLRRRHRT